MEQRRSTRGVLRGALGVVPIERTNRQVNPALAQHTCRGRFRCPSEMPTTGWTLSCSRYLPASLTGGRAMSQNKQTIERYLDGFRRSDHAQILDCLTEDVQWVIPGRLPAGGQGGLRQGDRERGLCRSTGHHTAPAGRGGRRGGGRGVGARRPGRRRDAGRVVLRRLRHAGGEDPAADVIPRDLVISDSLCGPPAAILAR